MGKHHARRLISTFVLIAISLFPFASRAAITEISFTGAVSFKDEQTTSLRIVAGKAAPTGFTGCGSDLCDTCTGTCNGGGACTVGVTPDRCNPGKWVSDTGTVVFNYKAATAGFPKIIADRAGTPTIIKVGASQVAANTAISLSARWDEICAATQGTACTDHSTTIQIGVSDSQVSTTLLSAETASATLTVGGTTAPATSTCDGVAKGMCGFTLFRGDNKAFIDQLDDNGNIPRTDYVLTLKKARFYFFKAPEGATDCSAATYSNQSDQFREISINAEGESSFLDSDIIPDLENGRVHCIVGASVDEAGNLGYWTPTVVPITPAEVIGYFTEENNCFIATAAYGSIMDPHVQVFRDFRDRVLSKFKPGQQFIRYYYQNAYHWARLIRKNEAAQYVARLGLWPLWLFAKLSLMFSWQMALFLFAAPLLGIVMLTGRFRSKKLVKMGALAFFLIFASNLAVSKAEAAVKKKRITEKREVAAETPPPEFPFPGAKEEEDDAPTPLKTPTAKKKVQPALPLQEPGEPEVVRITKDGVYYYKRKASPQKNAFAFRAGPFAIGDTVNPGTGLSFDSIYESNGTIVFFDWEYQLLQSIGKLGVKLGSGLFVTQGTGRFLDDKTIAREAYTFIMLPNNISAVYRFHYWDKQILVPYVEGGAGYYTFIERRDDGQRTKRGGVPIVQFAAGGSFLLDFLDSAAMVELDEDHSINHLYLTGEFRSITSMKEEFDITNNLVSFGFLFEF
ncbi:MAG: CFI-box-CTERM domain-containing protein [Bdellovibrionia bacterium]